MQAKFVGRWVPSGNNMTTGYPGSSFSFKVSGTHNVTIETSGASRVAYKIDDGSYVKSSSATVAITGLTLSTHTIKVVMTTSTSTWTGTNYATVSGMTVDQGGEIVVANPAKRRILVFGDSITEGWMYVAAESGTKSASELTYWNKLGDMLGADMIPSGFGGIGYVTNANGNFPKVSTNPSYIENTSSTLVNTDTNFDIILILLGVNDWKSTSAVDSDYVTAVTGCITRIKAKYPSADIHALIPFNNNGKPSLEQVYNAQGVHIIPQTWYSQIIFGDSVHPTDNGHTIIANNLKSYFENYYGSAYFKEVTMKRIDTVYIDTNGAVQKVTGTMADNPVKPILPSGAIRVSDIVVEQGASAGAVVDNRDWLKVYDNLSIVNVKDYGAKGDGSTDDTVAIQRAIDNNPGSSIVFPDGIYLVSSPIVTSATDAEKTSLYFLGSATIKASSSFPANSYILDIGGKGTVISGSAGNPRKCGVYGGRFVGNSSNTYGGIRTNMGQVILQNIYIEAINNYGLMIDSPSDIASSGIYMDLIYITGTGTDDSAGLFVAGYDNKMSRVRTYGFKHGIHIKGGGNFVRDCHPLGWWGYNGDFGSGFYDDGIDNTYHECYSDGFDVAFETGANCRRAKVIDMFSCYGTNRGGTFYKSYNDECDTVFYRANVKFNSGKTNKVIENGIKISYKMLGHHVFYDCYFADSGYQKAIYGQLSKNPRIFWEVTKNIDWNLILCDMNISVGLTATEANAIRSTYHLPGAAGEAMFGQLSISTDPDGLGAYGSCCQRFYRSDGKIFIRNAFYNDDDSPAWSAWKSVNLS